MLAILVILSILFSIYFIFADSENTQMNYKTCVKNNNNDAKACHSTARHNYKNCRNETKNNSNLTKIEKRDAYKNCINTYKTERNSCRNSHKENHYMCKQYKCSENEQFVDGKCVAKEIETNQATEGENNNQEENNETINDNEKIIDNEEIIASTEYLIYLNDGSFFVYDDKNKTSGNHITNSGMISETSTHYINVHEIVMRQCTKAPSGNTLCLESMVAISRTETNIGFYNTKDIEKGTKIIKEIAIIGTLDG